MNNSTFIQKSANVYIALSWIFDSALIILAAILLHYLVRNVFSMLERHYIYTKEKWKYGLVLALRLPLNILIWLTAISLVGDIVLKKKNCHDYLWSTQELRQLAILLCLSWFLWRWKKSMQAYLLSKPHVQKSFEKARLIAFGKLVNVIIVVLTIILGLQIIGFNIQALVALGGVGGLALGIAARDVVANFFSGFMIYVTKPFIIGDWIRVQERQIEGTVEEIGWYYTTIKSFSKHPLYIPNSIFSTVVVANPGRRTHWKIEEKLSISYSDFKILRPLIQEMQEMVDEHPDLDRHQDHFIYFERFGESALDITITVYTISEEKHLYPYIKQDILLKAGEIILKHGAKFGIPARRIETLQPL
ncbi:MAG: mechanosensitive ion channel [Parachlamydiales bacterium]|nr:mechanosensitive ion channel [Parachlamydiales bacterium]